jgi:hypothetical protein
MASLPLVGAEYNRNQQPMEMADEALPALRVMPAVMGRAYYASGLHVLARG